MLHKKKETRGKFGIHNVAYWFVAVDYSNDGELVPDRMFWCPFLEPPSKPLILDGKLQTFPIRAREFHVVRAMGSRRYKALKEARDREFKKYVEMPSSSSDEEPSHWEGTYDKDHSRSHSCHHYFLLEHVFIYLWIMLQVFPTHMSHGRISSDA